MADRASKRHRSEPSSASFPSGDVLALILSFLPQLTTFKSIVLVCKAFNECVKTNPLAWPAQLRLTYRWDRTLPPAIFSKSVHWVGRSEYLDRFVLATDLKVSPDSDRILRIPPLPRLRNLVVSGYPEVDVVNSLDAMRCLTSFSGIPVLPGSADVGLFPSIKECRMPRVLTRDQAAFLALCPNLEILHVSLGILGEDRPDNVTFDSLVGRFTDLRSLAISMYAFSDQRHVQSILRLLEGAPRLRSFKSANLDTTGAIVVALSRHCREIDTLATDMAYVDAESFTRDFKGLPNLKSVCITDVKPPVALLLCQSNIVEDLYVGFTLKADRGETDWIGDVPSVKSLKLNNVYLDELYPLVLPGLTHLHITNFIIDGSAFVFLGALADSCPRLETLLLYWNCTYPENFCAALPGFVASCPNLRKLHVSAKSADLERTCARCGVELGSTGVTYL